MQRKSKDSWEGKGRVINRTAMDNGDIRYTFSDKHQRCKICYSEVLKTSGEDIQVPTVYGFLYHFFCRDCAGLFHRNFKFKQPK